MTLSSHDISMAATLTIATMAAALVVANYYSASNWRDVNYLLAFITAQWMPVANLRNELQAQAWMYWEDKYETQQSEEIRQAFLSTSRLSVPTVDMALYDDPQSLLQHLETVHGADWRRRPLLFRNLWTREELQNPKRRLSLQGLLQETNLTIPYFTDARSDQALSPNHKATVSAIVANMTQRGMPHKIGSQFIVQSNPELIREVAPVAWLTTLFGEYFTPDKVFGGKGQGFLQSLFALTTVPVFVASTRHVSSSATSQDDDNKQQQQQQPYTALHCEPIGNIAVQLSGSKQWTLVDPMYSYLIRPSTAPDGRAFFASWRPNLLDSEQSTVPVYTATTGPGEALWVPTWTWHRVDYVTTTTGDDNNNNHDDIAIGGSLFHFRPKDFWVNNPLFAVLMVPAIVLELVGYNTQ